MLEEVVVSWWEVRWIWQMRQNFVAKFIQLLKCGLCDLWSGIVMGKNWAHSVDQCWLQVLRFLVHLIDLLSVLLCSGLAGIQKAIVDQQDHRPQDSEHDLLVRVWLSEVLWSFSQCSHWDGPRWLSYKTCFCRTSQSDRKVIHCCCIEWERATLQNDFFLFVVSSWGTHLIELFHHSNFLQMPNNYRRVDVEFFCNFLCIYKRIRFNDGSQLFVVKFRWLITMLLIFKALVSFAKLLETPLHCTFTSSFWANVLLMLRVVSAALQPILNSNKSHLNLLFV